MRSTGGASCLTFLKKTLAYKNKKKGKNNMREKRQGGSMLHNNIQISCTNKDSEKGAHQKGGEKCLLITRSGLYWCVTALDLDCCAFLTCTSATGTSSSDNSDQDKALKINEWSTDNHEWWMFLMCNLYVIYRFSVCCRQWRRWGYV